MSDSLFNFSESFLRHPETVPAETFGSHLKGLPDCRVWRAEAPVAATDAALGRIPELDPHHHFPKDLYLDLCAWWNHAGAEPLYLSGPAGSGKTSAVLAWCARLKRPVVSVTVRPRMDKRELLGRWVMTPEGGMRWVDGPALLAWRHGWVLLVNEFSAVPPEMWVSANDLLEGAPLEVDATGELVPRHPEARVVVTDNARGHASEIDAGYFGRSVMDRSVVDRFWHVRVRGLTVSEEAEVLRRRLSPDLEAIGREKAAGDLLTRLAECARDTRQGAGESAVGFSNRRHALSHRALVRLASMLLHYAAGHLGEVEKPVAWAVERAVANTLDEVPRCALTQLVLTKLGTEVEDLKRSFAEGFRKETEVGADDVFPV